MTGRHRRDVDRARLTAGRRGDRGGAHRIRLGMRTGFTTAQLRPRDGAAEEARNRLRSNDLWEGHGAAAYALARALLGNDLAAARAVERGMADVTASGGRGSPNEIRRDLARHVYLHCQELDDQAPWSLRLPASMVWLGQLAQLQRACLALCVFGGHTHREAAALIGVSPATVARSLTAGLRELGVLSSGGPAAATG